MLRIYKVKPKVMVKARYWISIIWAIVILILCGMPPKDVEAIKFVDIPYLDKIAHFALYLVFGLLVMAVLTLHKRLKASNWIYVIAILICILYGWLIEVLQRAIFPGRSYELMDLVADTAGAVIGVLLYGWVSRKLKRWLKIEE